MSGRGTTPTKPVASRRGRKPKETSASNNYRMCGCCFKTQFGNFKSGWISSENVFVAPTRKGGKLRKLADLLKTRTFRCRRGRRIFLLKSLLFVRDKGQKLCCDAFAN